VRDIRVCWRFKTDIGTVDYVLQQIRAAEMAYTLKKDPDAVGTPVCWAEMDDGDIAWWPNSMQGEPVVQLLPHVS
jgi:hypothetical protein